MDEITRNGAHRCLSGLSMVAARTALIAVFAWPLLAQQPPPPRRGMPVRSGTRIATPATPSPRGAPTGQQAPPPALTPSVWTFIGPAPLSVSGTGGNVNSNVSGRIAGVAAHPADANTIYVAAAGGGVWKTTNGGSAWTPLTDSQATLSMGAIAVAPSNPAFVYAGTGEANNSGDSNYGRGILVSTDAGATWILTQGPAGTFNTSRLTTAQIAVHPTVPATAYAAMADFGLNGACCTNTGIWKTTDGGGTWTNTTTSIDSSSSWSAVVIHPATPTTLYAALGNPDGATNNGVYKSIDGGGSWTRLVNAPKGASAGRIALALSPSNPLVLYVTASTTATLSLYKIMRSDDGGSTFTDLTAGTPNYLGGSGEFDTWVAVDPSVSSTIYVAGNAGANSVLRSTNSGVTWRDIHTGGVSTPHVDHHGVAFDANGKLLDGNDGGIWRLDNPTTLPATWTNLNGNLGTIEFTGIGLHPTDPGKAIAGSQDNATGLFNNDTIWVEVEENSDGGKAKYSPTNPSRLYHFSPVISVGSTAFFRRSDNGGTSWSSKVTGLRNPDTFEFYAPFVVDPGNGNRLLTGGDRIHETTNGGDSWTPLATPGSAGWATDGCSLRSIGMAASDVNTIYTACGSHLFVTANHGTSWTDHPLPTSGFVSDIQVDPANPLKAYAVISKFTASKSVYMTSNGGTTWSSIHGNLPDLPVWSLQLNPNGTIYVGADDGVYATTNGGTTWSRFGSGLPNAQVIEIVFSSSLNLLAAATYGRGAWEILTAGPSAPDLTISKTHTGNFTAGQTGATYTITVSNSGNGSTSGLVSVTDTLPSGLTPTGISGSGWNCTQPAGPCTRSDTLSGGVGYSSITLTVNVASNAPVSVTNTATVSGGGESNTGNNTASDPTTIVTGPDLTISKTHTGNFTAGQTAAAYTITVSNAGGSSSSGTVTVADTLPSGLTGTAIGGSGWACMAPAGPCTRSDVLAVGASYAVLTVTVNVAANAPASVINTASVSGGGESNTTNNTAADPTTIAGGSGTPGLQLVTVAPCRVFDSRNANGPLGGPFLGGGASRSIPVPSGSCGIPANAAAYSLNITVVPRSGTLGYLTVWPAGQAQPNVSTLNAPDGSILANAAIVPAGTGGAINAFALNDTDLIVDINGYFVPPAGNSLQFFPLTPCRVLDTRNANSTFGGPAITGGTSRSFPFPSSPCGLPSNAAAYSLNVTAVPQGFLGYATAYPTGQAVPNVSTLNSLDGTVLANAAIVPAGTGGAVSLYANNTTNLVVDINGYFAAPATGGKDFYTAPPCRLVDTRNAANSLGGPIMSGGATRTIPLPTSSCGLPSPAAYALNVTVVPSGPLGFVTVWPTGQAQPFVSTLNAPKGLVVANAALVPAGTGGSVDVFVLQSTHVIIDTNGYFQ